MPNCVIIISKRQNKSPYVIPSEARNLWKILRHFVPQNDKRKFSVTFTIKPQNALSTFCGSAFAKYCQKQLGKIKFSGCLFCSFLCFESPIVIQIVNNGNSIYLIKSIVCKKNWLFYFLFFKTSWNHLTIMIKLFIIWDYN